MTRPTFVVFRKELVDGLRDRRAWVAVVLTALLTGPLTLLLVSKFIGDVRQRAEAREVTVQNGAAAPSLINFLRRQGRTVVPPEDDVRARIVAGRFDSAVLVVPDGFERDVQRGQRVELPILHDANRAQSMAAAATLDRLVQGYGQELAAQRLAFRAIDAALVRPVHGTMTSVGGGRGGSGRLLFLVPMVALIAAVIGALGIAIDVTAGERERGSLEPLLLNPIGAGSLVLGKWFAVSTMSLATLAGTIVSFSVSTLFIRDEALAAEVSFGLREAGAMGAVLGPFCLCISAVLMLAALFARGHKEAQASTSLIVSTVGFVPSISMMLSLQDAPWQLLVPSLGQHMVLLRTFRGSPVGLVDFVVPAAVCALIAAAALWTVVRLLGREAIVFARS